MKRFSVKGGYVFDLHLLTTGYWFFLLFFACLAVYLQGHSSFFFLCSLESPTSCRNPFYTTPLALCSADEERFCTGPYLQPGESLGDPFPWWVEYSSLLAVALMLTPFLLNHVLHNRRYQLWKKLSQ